MTVTARSPRVAVVVFPGTWSERDFAHVAEAVLGWEARLVWHTDNEIGAPDAIVLPGGFAHGAHLRTGAIARFSPVMPAVEAFAAAGGPVIGSCNGFQVLTEAGMLPGALLRNDHLEFRCDWQSLRVDGQHGAGRLGDLADARSVLANSHGEVARSRRGRRCAGARGWSSALSGVRAGAVRQPNGRSEASPARQRAGKVGLMPHPSAREAGGRTDGIAFRSRSAGCSSGGVASVG